MKQSFITDVFVDARFPSIRMARVTYRGRACGVMNSFAPDQDFSPRSQEQQETVMLRVNVRSLVVLVGVLSLFCGSPAEAEAQLGSRLFRGRCFPRLFQQCPPQCPQPCPSSSRGPSMVFGCVPYDPCQCPTNCFIDVKCACGDCTYYYDSQAQAWRYRALSCVSNCSCELPTVTAPGDDDGTIPGR